MSISLYLLLGLKTEIRRRKKKKINLKSRISLRNKMMAQGKTLPKARATDCHRVEQEKGRGLRNRPGINCFRVNSVLSRVF